MKFLPLIIYVILALLIIIFLIFLIPDRKQYFKHIEDDEYEKFITFYIHSDNLKSTIFKLNENNQVLFYELYSYLLSLNCLEVIEKKDSIEFYISGVLAFVVDLSFGCVLFKSKINNLIYPTRFKNRGQTNFLYINTEVSLEDAKYAAFLIQSKLGR